MCNECDFAQGKTYINKTSCLMMQREKSWVCAGTAYEEEKTLEQQKNAQLSAPAQAMSVQSYIHGIFLPIQNSMPRA
jgi:hypothetical protein